MSDPLADTIYEALVLWLQNKVAPANAYGSLNPKTSALMLELVQRIKKLNTADRPLEFQSIVSSMTQEPKIRVVWGDYEGQLLPHQARQLSFDIIDVVHAAEADSFLYSLIVDKMGLQKEAAYQVLVDFRQYRQDMAKQQRESGAKLEVVVPPGEREDEPEGKAREYEKPPS